MQNRNLLLTLAEIAAASDAGRPVLCVPELGADGTSLGVAVAKARGLASDFFGALDLTEDGEAYAARELARLKPLFARVQP